MPNRTPIQILAASLFLAPTSIALANSGGTGGVHGINCHCLEGRLEAWTGRRWLLGDANDFHNGRWNANAPRSPEVDFTHMHLDLFIADMNTPTATATQKLTFETTARPITTLTLDAGLMQIHKVTSPYRPLNFTHDGETLTITFAEEIPAHTEVTLHTEYTITDPPHGLHWFPEDPAVPGRDAQIHTQGQPEFNHYWFPCHDFPNDRLMTEIRVTLPQGYEVSSNGRLVAKDRKIVRDENNRMQPYDVFHWAQDEKAGGGHPPYLVTLVIGKFDIVDLGNDDLSLPVYVPPGMGPLVENTYGNTAAMGELFTDITGIDYPWGNRYAQLVVYNFGWGGMENTAATTMFDTAIFLPGAEQDHDLDGLISHELIHQWFGDSMTCRSWEHIWLNEGFATYFTALWFEKRDGEDGYLAQMRRNFDSVIANDTGSAPDTPGMASDRYDEPWDVFRRGANPYPKGASTLHTLRRHLGDLAFFDGIKLYVERHAPGQVETPQFRRAMEDASGESLGQFFDQMVRRPNIPRLDIAVDWVGGSLTIDIEQTQPIDQFNPAFSVDLPVFIRDEGAGSGSAEGEVVMLSFDTRTHSVRLPRDVRPDMVVFNHDLHTLAELDIDMATILWMNQLASGPTVAAQIEAARALASPDQTAGAPLLWAAARDTSAHSMLRLEAVKALEAQGDLSRVYFLLADEPNRIDDPAARAQVARSLGQLGFNHPTGSTGKARDQIRSMLVDLAETDDAVTVRAAAIEALGTMKAVDAAETVYAAVNTVSQHDAIRRAAFDTLADFNLPEALDTVARFMGPNALSRTRADAITAARRLAVHDQPRVRSALIALLTDTDARTQRTAGEQLVELGDTSVIPDIERVRDSLQVDFDRMMFQDWIDALNQAG